MEFIDLHSQQKRIIDAIETNIKKVLTHGTYILGPEVEELEKTLAEYTGSKHAVGCASGTDALLMALMAHNIGPGDALFTTPFTFIATAEVISLLGATPIFVDIDPATFNISPTALSRAVQGVTKNDPSIHPLPTRQGSSPLVPRGIIAVDLFGLPADYDALGRIAEECDLWVIEDAAQSFGAVYRTKKAGSLAHIACTSFFPAKPLGCYGDGGMCFTDDDQVAEVLRSIMVHGKGSHKYDNIRIGINGRLDTMQAAILLAKFDIFPEELTNRRKIADRYGMLLSELPLVTAPSIPEGYESAWAQYSIMLPDNKHRESVLNRCSSEGIPTAIYYPRPLHLQKAFGYQGYKTGDFPVSEDVAGRILSLPMHPYLLPEDQEKIALVLASATTAPAA